MSKFGIINLIDKIFVTLAIFLIIYAWINFYVRDLWATFVLSVIFTFACVFLLYFAINKKQAKKNISTKKNKEIDENFLAFKLLNKQEKLELLNSILIKDYITILKKNCLSFVKDNKKFLVIIATHIKQMSQEDLLNTIDLNHSQQCDGFLVICNDVSTNINTKIFNNKSIEIVTKTKLYSNYFEKHNLYPDKSEINFNSTKLSWTDILKGVFIPKKSKAYFVYGLLLIFSSLILPYHAYYIVFGSMLLLFSVICKILPKFTNN